MVSEAELQATGLSARILDTYRLAHAHDPPFTSKKDYENLAIRLGTTANTVKTRLARIRKKLKDPSTPLGTAGIGAPGVMEKTDPEKVAKAVVAMSSPGAKVTAIAKEVGLSPKVAVAIGKTLDTDLLPLGRAITEVRLEEVTKQFGTLARDAVTHITHEKLEKANARDLAIIAGVAIDKWQLLRGQPTQRMEIGDRRNLNELVTIIMKEARRRNVVIDITPEGGVTAGKSKYRNAMAKRDVETMESGDPAETLAPA